MNRDSEHLACRFDAYCKRLLKNEVIDAIRGEKRMGQREVAFSDLKIGRAHVRTPVTH